MSLKYLFIITLFLPAARLVAQDNLVPNHSFENYENCPDMFSRVLHPWDTLEIVYLKDWLSPNYGSSDYYNACSPSDSTISVPQNIAGYIPSVKGNAYAGIYTLATYETFNNDWTFREYLQIKLVQPLEKDVEYCVSFYTRPMRHNRSDSSSYIYMVQELGLYLSPDQPINNAVFAGTANIDVVPQLMADAILDITDWKTISMIYKATGGEQWITIGNFYDDFHTTNRLLIESPVTAPPTSFGPLHYSYYFIDEVSVFPIKGVRAFYLDTYKVCDQLLPAAFTARDNLDHYQWSTGETTVTAHFDQPGWQYIDASYAGCPFRDSVLFSTVSPPSVNLGPDIDLCENGQLNIVTLINTEPLSNYYWSTSSASPELTTNIPGIYRLSTEHLCGHIEDDITLYGCNTSIYIPNVITPESNDANSIFLPFTENIALELLEIYDHFGRKIYQEEQPANGWNGYIKGRLAPSGVYMYRIRYRNITDNIVSERLGDVTVIR